MKNENIEKIIIKAIYYSKSGFFLEKEFNQDATFGDILYYLTNSSKNQLLIPKENYYYFGKNLSPNQKIKDLVYLQKGKSYKIEIKIEINENEKIDDEAEVLMPKIMKPKLYTFGLYIYYPQDGIIALEQYSPDTIKEYNLDNITSGCSYCNSPEFFFISGGGHYSNNPIKDFWIFNKENLKIEKKIMPIPKRDHSMICVSNNLIFIIGGNDKKCCYYDIQKGNFSNWAFPNKDYKRPALIFYKNYIYCLGELSHNYNYFERTCFSNQNPSWEKIFPKFKRKVYLFNKKIFFASKCTNDSIIFSAGNSIKDSKIYIYDLLNNEISLSKQNSEFIYLNDKSFYKVSKYYNIAIPNDYEIKKPRNIFILNKKEKKFDKIYFYEYKGVDKIKMEDYDDFKEQKEISNIKIKTNLLDKEAKYINNNYNSEFPNYKQNNIETNKSYKISYNNSINNNKELQIGENEAFFKEKEEKNILRGQKDLNQEKDFKSSEFGNGSHVNLINTKENTQNNNSISDINTSTMKNNNEFSSNNLGETEKYLIREIRNDNRNDRYNTQKKTEKKMKISLPRINRENNFENKSLNFNDNNNNINYNIQNNVEYNLNNNNIIENKNEHNLNNNNRIENKNEIFKK